MFVKSSVLLKKAQQGKYAVPAFNTSNLEVTQALFEAAEQAKAPLIVSTTHSTINYAGLENLFALVKEMEQNAKIPVCIHLDHGKNFEIAKKCIGLGYKSVMIDASKKLFAENVKLSKKVVAFAHKKGASVEAELGALGKIGRAKLTDPALAGEFVKKTKVDLLAVAVGTSHGAYKFSGKPKIDLNRIEEIRDIVPIPLVLHGASSVPKEFVNKAEKYGARLKHAKGVPLKELKKAIKLGISKINIDTDLRLAFSASLREFLHNNPKSIDPRDALGYARESVKRIALQKFIDFGCRGKA